MPHQHLDEAVVFRHRAHGLQVEQAVGALQELPLGELDALCAWLVGHVGVSERAVGPLWVEGYDGLLGIVLAGVKRG